MSARRPLIEFAPGSVTKPRKPAPAGGASREAAREHKVPGAKIWIVTVTGRKGGAA
jgi:hypothetical protein